MKILALIPARGGSKRVTDKNIRLLGDKPLLFWTIQVVKDIPEICDALVSTDDQRIVDIARSLGGLVPWLRPAHLATDTAKSVDVALHALDWYENENGPVDGLMLLQPTTPFRRPATIKLAIEQFVLCGGRPVIGVSPAASHPEWCYRIEQDTLRQYADREYEDAPLRSQDLPPAYALNGAMYLVDPQYLRKTSGFLGADAYPLIIDDPIESIDIDTEFDFFVAECVAEKIKPFRRAEN